MTYEEKLDLILRALFEAKKATIEGKTIQLYVKNGNNGLDILPRSEIYSILKKLQVEEKILRVWWETDRILPLDYHEYVDSNFILVRCSNTFDDWYKQYSKELSNELKSNRIETVTKEISYEPQTGQLTIEGKKIRFRKDSFRAKLLELLLRNDRNRKKEWSWDKLFKKIEASNPHDENQDKNRQKIYDAAKGLNRKILEYIGIRELLIFTTKTVKVNPKYLK